MEFWVKKPAGLLTQPKNLWKLTKKTGKKNSYALMWLSLSARTVVQQLMIEGIFISLISRNEKKIPGLHFFFPSAIDTFFSKIKPDLWSLDWLLSTVLQWQHRTGCTAQWSVRGEIPHWIQHPFEESHNTYYQFSSSLVY